MTGPPVARAYKADDLSYFKVEYGNTTSNYIECGTAPSMAAYKTTIFDVSGNSYVQNFTLYCSNPQLARFLKITAPQNLHFELCEVKVFAAGMCNIEFFMRRSNCSHLIPRPAPGSGKNDKKGSF